MKNPVMLSDHRNAVDHLVGSWTKVGTNARGLAVQGRLSNAPECATRVSSSRKATSRA